MTNSKTKEELIAAYKALELAIEVGRHFTPQDELMCMMAAVDALKWASGYPADSDRLENFYKAMEIALKIR